MCPGPVALGVADPGFLVGHKSAQCEISGHGFDLLIIEKR